jgi:hypothetical protein
LFSVQEIHAGQTIGAVIDDKMLYLCLGAKSDKYFMQLEDFDDALNGKKRRAEFTSLKNGDTKLFPVWSFHGKTVTQLPRTLYARYSLDMAESLWREEQRKKWDAVIISAGDETTTVPYNVFARFI